MRKCSVVLVRLGIACVAIVTAVPRPQAANLTFPSDPDFLSGQLPTRGKPAPPSETQAQDRARAEAASKRAAERIKALQREADALVKQERTLLAELRKLEIDRELRVEELGQIEREMAETKQALADTTARAASLQNVVETQRPEVEARLVQLYKMGRAGYWRLLLDTKDIRSIGRAYRTASAMTRLDRERVQAHAQTIEALRRERRDLEARLKTIASLQGRAIKARAAADRAVAARTALIASIDQRRDLNAQLMGELEAAQQKLQRTVIQLGRPASTALPIRPFRGALPWPCEGGIVTGRFGSRQNAAGAASSRNGIDISLAEGEPVRSVHEGTVAFADAFTGYGNLVIIDHGDGSHSLYGHLRDLRVERGTHVDAQTQVGESGRNPAGNPSLYFELRVDGKPVDPLQWLRKPL
jgi:septal ring factor EnvC (AmiA/AmiB activator)